LREAQLKIHNYLEEFVERMIGCLTVDIIDIFHEFFERMLMNFMPILSSRRKAEEKTKKGGGVPLF
jgi:hypothetical protein